MFTLVTTLLNCQGHTLITRISTPPQKLLVNKTIKKKIDDEKNLQFSFNYKVNVL